MTDREIQVILNTARVYYNAGYNLEQITNLIIGEKEQEIRDFFKPMYHLKVTDISEQLNRYDPTATNKRCTDCFEVKSYDDYSSNPRSRDGKNSVCKKCAAMRSRRTYYAEKEMAI
jgi:hypothetical protein